MENKKHTQNWAQTENVYPSNDNGGIVTPPYYGIIKSNTVGIDYKIAFVFGIDELDVMDKMEFIVTACNAHDKLVEALKAFIHMLESRSNTLTTPERLKLDDVRTLLNSLTK